MAGLTLLPTTLTASVVALILTSNIGLIESQRRRTDAMRAVWPEPSPTLGLHDG